MTVLNHAAPPAATLPDLVERLGSVPLERILDRPVPGTATEEDVLARPVGEERLYELVDGVLVEKPMGFYESILTAVLVQLMRNFLDEHDLGIVLGADGALRLAPGLVRAPDAAFLSWERFPGRVLPAEPIPDLAPDFAVEVLSKGNTSGEMERKLREYFAAGTRLVWYLDPPSRTVRVFTSPDDWTVVSEDGALEGGAVLPGFRLTVREWLERAGGQQGSG